MRRRRMSQSSYESMKIEGLFSTFRRDRRLISLLSALPLQAAFWAPVVLLLMPPITVMIIQTDEETDSANWEKAILTQSLSMFLESESKQNYSSKGIVLRAPVVILLMSPIMQNFRRPLPPSHIVSGFDHFRQNMKLKMSLGNSSNSWKSRWAWKNAK